MPGNVGDISQAIVLPSKSSLMSSFFFSLWLEDGSEAKPVRGLVEAVEQEKRGGGYLQLKRLGLNPLRHGT